MDWLDKKIIQRLMNNCRESYHSIARAFGVTCPTIIYRVNRLRQMGVIQRFVAELSQETLGVEWILTELKVDKRIDRQELLNIFNSHKCIGEVFFLGGERYLVLSEVFPHEREGFISCLESVDKIEHIRVRNIEPISRGLDLGRCRYTTRGERIRLTGREVKILQMLLNNARMPTRNISEALGQTEKSVRRTIRKFIRCDGVHLTLRLNLSQCERINFILRNRLRSNGVNVDEVAKWVMNRYPEQHWFTLSTTDSKGLIHFMTADRPSDIQDILQGILREPNTEDVEARIIYSVFKSEGRTQEFLADNAQGLGRDEEWEIPITSSVEDAPKKTQVIS